MPVEYLVELLSAMPVWTPGAASVVKLKELATDFLARYVSVYRDMKPKILLALGLNIGVIKKLRLIE
jgi:hypothetical protein